MPAERPASEADNLATAPAGLGKIDDLMRVLYDDLRRVAAGHLHAERRDHTLQPTALVHEAYLRLAQQHKDFSDRNQFVALASTMMRRILVDHARARHSDKRGGDRQRLTIAGLDPAGPGDGGQPQIDLLALNDALERLAAISPEQARLVELRFFGGLNIEQTAVVMNIGRRSADREWACAKAWLFRELGG